VLTFETSFMAHDGDQPLQAVTWQIDQRLGDYDLMGEWIGPGSFLIYETLAEGPLILDVNAGVIPVLGALFGLSEAPSILGEEGYSLRALSALGAEPGAYHLVLSGIGDEGSFPPVRVYHSESELVETLPYRHPWWTPFSPDGGWLLMDERPVVDGYESHALWARPVDEVDGAWQPLAAGVDALLWSDDGTEMVFGDDSRITWQGFPGATPIGQWDSGPFWAHPVAWAPDGRHLAAVGSVPGEWRSGLFILRAD
jgi:hypothetical protein